MTSIVSICNLALGSIGKNEISALTEASAEARACSRFFGPALESLLAAYPWRFAAKDESLAEVENTKVGEWLYAYKRPVSCARLLTVKPKFTLDNALELRGVEADQPFGWPYDTEGDTIFCNLSPAVAVYVNKATDPTKFPPLFVEALSWHLATKLAIPLTRDLKQRDTAWKLAQQMTATASATDANEVRNTSETGSDYERARA